MQQASEILKQKIKDLPFSEELKNILLTQKHSYLQDVLNVPAKDWMQYEGFNYHHLKEITGYVQENGVASYLKH